VLSYHWGGVRLGDTRLPPWTTHANTFFILKKYACVISVMLTFGSF